MGSFFEKLRVAQQRAGSALVLRLDVITSQLPLPILPFDEPLLPFARAVIEATHDLVCAYAVAPDVFLAEGAAGVVALERIARLIPPDVPLIFDGAFGGDAWLARSHARGAFEQFRADALTVSTSREDVLQAIASHSTKGCFLLASEHAPETALRSAARHGAGAIVIAAQVPAARSWTQQVPLWVRDAESLDLSSLPALVQQGRTEDGLLPMLQVSQRVLGASRRVDFVERMREAALMLREAVLSSRA